jgi:hypothetical protein
MRCGSVSLLPREIASSQAAGGFMTGSSGEPHGVHHVAIAIVPETDMNATDLTARLSAVIYPVMILAGAAWGATGEVGSGLAALLVAALVLGAARA